MATTLTATKQLPQTGDIDARAREQEPHSPGVRLGVRARQIALITLLVALVVVVTTAVNIANLTAVIISRTQQEASQVSDQINYAISQTLAQNSAVAKRDEYTALVSEPSSVRGLM